MMNGREKSDSAVLARKPANNAGRPDAEQAERRAGTKGNTGQSSTCRAQNRASVSQGLERVRQAAKQRKKERFTALLHHVTVDRLRESFFVLKRNASPGVDGMTWRYYEAGLDEHLQRLMAGHLPDHEAEQLEQHLLHCPRCADRLQTLPVDDALVTAVRTAQPSAAQGPEQAIEMVRRALALPGDDVAILNFAWEATQ